MVNPFAPYLSIINFALEPILKIGFAIVVAGSSWSRSATTRSASPWVGSSRRSGRSFRGSEMRRILIFVAVSLAAACVAVEGPPRRTPTTATRIETNTSVDVDEPETYAQEIDEDTRLVEWEYDEDREGFIPF